MDQIHSAMVMLKVYLFKKSEITKLNYSKLNLTMELFAWHFYEYTLKKPDKLSLIYPLYINVLRNWKFIKN